MTQPWDATAMRSSIQRTLREHAPVGAPATWVLSNHDITRPVTRYGREDSGFAFARKRFGTPTDLTLGTRRARAAVLLIAALPGALYIYQGDELGLPEVELPAALLQDPMHSRSGGIDPGRDGCRVPLPWSGQVAPFGFGTGAADRTWLPQPDGWATLTVEAEAADPGSMLSLYKAALRIRHDLVDLGGDAIAWLDLGEHAIAFTRGAATVSVTNFGPHPMELPAHRQVLLSSVPLEGALLPPDSTAWLAL